ncbi:MAG: hypothetical protein JNL79_00210 [Myxococcales bacterium]|nr:hypothetical protein [Myxococcales bacterium]
MRRSLFGLSGLGFLLVACSSGGGPEGVATSGPSALVLARPHAARPAPLGRSAGGYSVRAEIARGAARATLPLRADGLVKVELGARTVELSSPDLAARTGALEDDTVSYTDVAPRTDLVLLALPDGFEDLRVLRDEKAPTTFRVRARGEGLTLRAREGRLELVNDAGRVELGTAPVVAVDAKGVKRALSLSIEGDVATMRLPREGLAYPIVVDPLWSATPNMSSVRDNHFGVVLADGRMMVGGGVGGPFAEIYSATTNTWTSAGYPSDLAWSGMRGVRLADGSVLVVAGGTDARTARWTSGTSWTLSGNQAVACQGCALVRLADNRVLKVPGVGNNTEIYNPASGTWSSSTTSTSFSSPTAVLLADGRVLAIGGPTYQAPMIWNAGTWSTTSGGPARTSGNGPALERLPDGRVLAIGSWEGGSTPPKTGYLYTPGTNAWTLTKGEMLRVRNYATIDTLKSGKVLISGGEIPGATIGFHDAEIYDPATEGFWPAENIGAGRRGAVSGVLGDGSVLIAGGQTSPPGSYGPSTTAMRYVGLTLGASCAPPNVPVACDSGFCTEGVCCEAAACVKGTCASAARPGFCTKNDGEKCTVGTQCTSGLCADGVCCNSACGGQCESCNLPGTVGTCAPVLGAPAAGHPACGGTGVGTTCAAVCNGVDRTKCNYPGSTLACGKDSCASGVEIKAGTCNGAGTCTTTSASCGAYTCGASACKRSCVTDVDCDPGSYCGGDKCLPRDGLGEPCKAGASCGAGLSCVDGVCCGTASCPAKSSCSAGPEKGKCSKLAGADCTTDAECSTGVCADGVCCDRACGGQCEACNVGGSEGKCSPVRGEPRGTRAKCDDGAGDVCKALECDGVKDPTKCVAFRNGGTVTCKPAVCDGGSLVPVSSCDGAGTCVTPPKADCGRYTCDPAPLGCRTSCSTNAHCNTGFFCVGGKCSEGARCSDDLTTSTSTDGVTVPCAPYKCSTAGTCKDSCGTSDDCLPGAACESGKCVSATAPAVDDSGGCALGTSAGRSSSAAAALTLLALAGLSRRRRR